MTVLTDVNDVRLGFSAHGTPFGQQSDRNLLTRVIHGTTTFSLRIASRTMSLVGGDLILAFPLVRRSHLIHVYCDVGFENLQHSPRYRFTYVRGGKGKVVKGSIEYVDIENVIYLFVDTAMKFDTGQIVVKAVVARIVWLATKSTTGVRIRHSFVGRPCIGPSLDETEPDARRQLYGKRDGSFDLFLQPISVEGACRKETFQAIDDGLGKVTGEGNVGDLLGNVGLEGVPPFFRWVL